MKTVLCVLLLLTACSAEARPPQVYGAVGRYLGNLSANRYDPRNSHRKGVPDGRRLMG
jgi:hypothetical protein